MTNWKIKQLLEEAKKALNIEGLAQGIADKTKENITDNAQIDSSFMKESVYIVTDEGANTYGQTWAEGDYYSTKTRRDAKREKAGVADLGDATALIGVAADYAIYNEVKDAFLYPALESGKDILPKVVKSF